MHMTAHLTVLRHLVTNAYASLTLGPACTGLKNKEYFERLGKGMAV